MLRPGPLDRGRVPEGAATRLLVGPDGALLREDGHATRVLAQPGTVGRPVRVLPDAAPGLGRRSPLRGFVVLPVEGSEPLALPLDLWSPGWRQPSGDPVTETGLRQVLQQLGRDDAYSFDVSPGAWSGGAQAVVPAPEEPWWRTPTALAGLVAVGILVSALLGPAGATAVLVGVALAEVAVVWAVVRAVVWARRTSAPLPGAVDEWAGTLPRTRVAVVADGSLVVVDESGRACALPGPGEAHGARRALVLRQGGRALAVRVAADRGVVLVSVPASWWGDSEERLAGLLDVVRAAGLAVEDVVVPEGRDPQVQRSLSLDRGLVLNAPSLFPACALAVLPLVLVGGIAVQERSLLAVAVLPAAAVAVAVTARGAWLATHHPDLADAG